MTTIKIKPGDIVEYQGKHVRVMDMTNTPSGFRELLKLSHFGNGTAISVNDVKLVESIPEPTIKNHDDVIIIDIPEDEKEYYGVGWGPNMDKLVSSGSAHKITDIHYSDRFGWFGCIDGYNFQLYHIESVSNFDMI